MIIKVEKESVKASNANDKRRTSFQMDPMRRLERLNITCVIMTSTPSYVASLDVGTTSVRCFIINDKCEIKGSAVELVDLLNPHPGHFEIEPESLWSKIVHVIKRAIQDAQLTPAQISCLGVSTQRCTFLTWNHKTQEYFHNFITWKDLRSDALVDEWNAGYTLKTINALSYLLYLTTRSKRFLAGSVIKMMNGQVTLRLLHEIRSNARLRQALKQKTARIELLDSWILYKLRSGNGFDSTVEHISDVTSCTATGLYDPFTLGWSPLVKLVFGIDPAILPKVVDNAYKHFGYVHPMAFNGDPQWQNLQLPIASSVSDQTASMWGSHCFDEGDVKITMGTGAFLNLITGGECHASLAGMYPLVAWQYDRNHRGPSKTTFCVEGAAHDMGTVIAWAQSCGLITDLGETAALAEAVDDTSGVYFVPAFSGLGPPVNDHRAASGFIGITPSTTRNHLVRAILESIVFRLVLLCETVQRETKHKMKLLRVDGGVSRNDFVCQFLADASGIPVERSQNAESSIMGVTYMAGLNYGIWQDLATIRPFRMVDRVFTPRSKDYDNIKERMETWHEAIERFGMWY